MIRLFIPFPIPANLRDRLATTIGELKSSGRNVKWVDPNSLHLTAHFLGDTDPKQVQPLIKQLEITCARFGPVTCTVDRLGDPE